MAQKITGYIKLQIPAGKATPAPPVGPALGQHGVNIMDFTKQFNEKTQKDAGLVIPVVITVYQDRSFTFVTKTPPAPVLIKRRARFRAVRVYRIRQRLHKSAKQTLKLLLNKKCPILTQLPLRQLCL